MLHSRKLLYVDEIARCGSIRKAAARLNVASSAVNRQILALEEEIGAPIFERLPRGLRLTAAGELCIEHIREVLKNYERLEGRIRGLKMPQAGKVSMPEKVSTRSGEMAIGGSAKSAILTPRPRRAAAGNSAKTAPAAMASRLPMRKPRPAPSSVAQICGG